MKYRLNRLSASVVALALLVSISAAQTEVRYKELPNFRKVQDHLYRGGQPETCAELDYLRSLGVRRIVKLNDRGLAQDEAEKSAAARLGLEVLSWPFDASTIGTPASCPDVREALDALRAGDAPVFVHCTAGKDRTGYLIGLYERLVLRKAAPDVLEELRRYGHRGARAAVFPQISRELRKELPACAAE